MSARVILDRVMRVEQPDHIEASDGSVETIYSDQGTVFVNLAPASLAERQSFSRSDGIASHKATLRIGSAIAGGWRLREGTRTFRVLAVDDTYRRSGYVTCLIEEEGR